MSCFSQNFFFLIPIMVSSSREIVLTQKIHLYFRVKDIDEYVSTIRKSSSHFKKYLKKLKKFVSTSINMVRLKIDFPLI